MLLPREAVRRVLEAKIRAEIAAARRLNGRGSATLPPGPWPDEVSLSEESRPGTGSDSLERLWVAAAVNEMFHLDDHGEQERLPGLRRFGEWVDAVAGCTERGFAAVTFTTSGSTGEPKRCTHRTADLAEEVDHLASLFADRARLVAAVPPHHIYGFLFTVLLPDRLGRPVVAVAEAGSLRAGDLLVSFPDHWAFVERSTSAFADDVSGVTSTAPCPPALIAALMDKGLGGFTEVYGSSETAGIGTRRWPAGDYTLMPHWTKAAEESDATLLERRDGRRAELMDRLAWTDARSFRVEGRRDSAVQVAGINVFPARVAAVLKEHPDVADAAVRGTALAEGGRLKAFIVPRDPEADVGALDESLRAWAAERLASPERPQAYRFGPALPRGDLGKLKDW
ncbi:MAG TPA: AMP-binding protein [Microvirga sp.]|jgi:4-coumarate--CoA ligase (photoactive yellow protein activation family)|nr:AMP-binding protein [Microvirga sp.]